MAKGLGTLTVWLTADSKKLESGFAKAKKLMMQWKTASILGATAAGAALTAFGISSIKAWSQQEEAVNNLEAALNAGGDNVEYFSQRFQKFASDMQSKTIFGDEATLDIITYGRNLGITSDKLEEATTAAAGLAAKYKLDLQSAMQLIGRAANGNTGMLSRYGIVLDDTLSKEEKFNQLLKIGTDNFSLAEAKANTLTGKYTQLENAYGDLKEAVGKVITESLGLNSAMDQGKNKITEWTEYINAHGKEWSYVFQEIVIYVQSGVQTLSALLQPFFNGVWGLVKFTADVFFTAGKNIGSTVEWLLENWSKVFENMGNIAFALVKDIGNAYKNLGVNIWKSITLQDTDWTGALADLGKNIDKALANAKIPAMEIASPDWEGLKQTFSDSFDQLKKIPDAISEIADARDEALDQLFKNKMDEINKPVQQRLKNPQQQEKGGVKMESSIVGAVHKGTIEALKLENTRSSKDDQIEQNTRKTAKGIDKLVQLIGNGLSSQTTSAINMEDAFA